MQNDKNNAEIILTLDIGGTFIKSAVFTGGIIRRLPPVPSCSDAGRQEIAEAIRKAIAQVKEFTHLAVAIPGPFDFEHGIFRMTHKFAAVNGCSFEELSGHSASFLHDANAFLLGELTHGAARGFQRCGGITLGTGLGAAFAVNGDLLTGADGSPAPEVKLWNKPFRDGIAEDYVSARSLLSRFPAGSVKAIADAAKNGNAGAKKVWLGYGSALYEQLSGWKNQLNPEVIVVGGQIARDMNLFGAFPAELPLRISELGEDAALYGAYEYVRRKEREEIKGDFEEYLRRAVSATDGTGRLNRFFEKAERGETLTVGVLGGSITAGAACPAHEQRYHGVLLNYLRKRFPRSVFTLINAGIGATASDYGALRAERDLLSEKPDLVILEFAVNDLGSVRYARTYEGTVRQILRHPDCALILLFMMHNTTLNAQIFQEQIGRHYALPMASYRDALMPELANGSILWEELSPDTVHPRSAAHSFAGRLLTGLLARTGKSPAPQNRELPPPLYSAEYEHCFLHERETLTPAANSGWEQIPSGGKLAGFWRASTPGTEMELEFEGTSLMFSCWSLKGPQGTVSVQTDQLPAVKVDSYFAGDWGGGKQSWYEIAHRLAPGKHRVRITLLAERNPESGGSEFILCGIGGTTGTEAS